VAEGDAVLADFLRVTRPQVATPLSAGPVTSLWFRNVINGEDAVVLPAYETCTDPSAPILPLYDFLEANVTLSSLPPYTCPAFLQTPTATAGLSSLSLYNLTQATPATGSLCVILYGAPGTVDYPWSSATSVTFTYNPTPVQLSAGPAVSVVSGSGSRTFTNRFGASFTTALTIAAAGTDGGDSFLYLNSSIPVDGAGLTWQLSSPIQLPGSGPTALYSQVNVRNVSGVVQELHSSRVDPLGQAFLSSVPAFVNATIGASNINALAPSYATCQAPITFTNGLRPPTQPTVTNGALHFAYSYSISDGLSYRVQGNLTFSATSAFASSQDELGNPYQTLVNVSGTRLYTHLPSGLTVLSSVTGLSASANGSASQRFYPYALLSSAPGVYSLDTAPLFDGTGVAFTIQPPAPVDGAVPGTNATYSSVSLSFTASVASAYLTEGLALAPPALSLQRQLYALLQ
jgi:hypothetical protein